jgi:hypothetical protein
VTEVAGLYYDMNAGSKEKEEKEMLQFWQNDRYIFVHYSNRRKKSVSLISVFIPTCDDYTSTEVRTVALPIS